jgi:hypothetical protein
MKQLRTLKNASKLRRHGLLMAVIPNATRWGSLLACLLRYDNLHAAAEGGATHNWISAMCDAYLTKC